MTARANPERNPPNALTVRLGRWFEAGATGWGVVVIPVIVVLVLAATAAHVLPA
jgi:hypothetical protein